jgi:integrase
MTTTTPSTAVATIQPAFTDAERLALAGFLAGYRGLTREAYTLDLRQFTAWCRARSFPLFSVRRADIETFARELEARGRARATVTRRLCTIAGFCRYAVEEELLGHSPAAHVRRPRLDYESHATALDRNELGALLVAPGSGPTSCRLRSRPSMTRRAVTPRRKPLTYNLLYVRLRRLYGGRISEDHDLLRVSRALRRDPQCCRR